MEKTLFLALSLAFFSLAHAQTYSTGHLTVVLSDAISHDSTFCKSTCVFTYTITVDSSWVGDSAYIVDTSDALLVGGGMHVNTTGVTPWTFSVVVENMTNGDATIPPGGGYAYFRSYVTKVVSGADTFRYIAPYDSLLVTNPCGYGDVYGQIYVDNNTNCINDLGDGTLNVIWVAIADNVSSPPAVINYQEGWGGGGGSYHMIIQQSWMTNYTVALPDYYYFCYGLSPCFLSPTYTFTTLPQTGVDFPLNCTSNVDVQVGELSPNDVRPHKPFYMHPYATNLGCDTVSGTVHLVLDSRVIYDPTLSTHPADTVSGDTLIWNYSALSNITASGYWNSFLSDVYLAPDSTVAVGDTLCFRVYANVPPADVNPLNNDYTVCLPVVYSYDPNEKSVSPAGVGPEGLIPPGPDTLSYTINFQNTGTAAAYDVKVVDTLNSHLNARSLRILGASANMSPKWNAPNVIEFDFNNIMLPDSATDEPGSHGQVRFSVGLNPAVPEGTQIKNTGYIYFDANPAVVTNTALNTIYMPSGTQVISAPGGIRVYPNPAADHISVDGPAVGEVSVMSVSGQIVLQQSITSNHTTLDIASLPAGVYILKTVNAANTATVKFTKY